MQKIHIFLPGRSLENWLSKSKETFFTGYVHSSDLKEITVFITKIDCNEKILDNIQQDNAVYGYCNYCQISRFYLKNRLSHNILILSLQERNLYVHELIIKGKLITTDDNTIILFYEENSMKYSETLCMENFSKLQYYMQRDFGMRQNITIDPLFADYSWSKCSMLAHHLLNYMSLLHWIAEAIKRNKKVSIKQWNFILAIILDIILGYLIFYYLTEDMKELSNLVMGGLENLVNMLHNLLKWLMGAPAGLKLNNAFNKMLGKYFSYHIQLWWLFLDVSGARLDVILQIYHCIGYLGLTFQAAMLSDMICIATFHSYCIYVYAARLFNIQISGLTALLRLFVGRKYNPLRGGVDSCEYTNQELFVGTVAFTILLLLLPTTSMYYIVFTLFRLFSLVVQYILAKLIYLIQTSPLYVIVLWMSRSPKVAGNISMEVVSNEDSSPIILNIKLSSGSLQELISKFRPPVQMLKQVEWTNVLSNIFVGKQIV